MIIDLTKIKNYIDTKEYPYNNLEDVELVELTVTYSDDSTEKLKLLRYNPKCTTLTITLNPVYDSIIVYLDGTSFTGTSDSNGQVVFTNVPYGNYVLKDDYIESSMNITVNQTIQNITFEVGYETPL